MEHNSGQSSKLRCSRKLNLFSAFNLLLLALNISLRCSGVFLDLALNLNPGLILKSLQIPRAAPQYSHMWPIILCLTDFVKWLIGTRRLLHLCFPKMLSESPPPFPTTSIELMDQPHVAPCILPNNGVFYIKASLRFSKSSPHPHHQPSPLLINARINADLPALSLNMTDWCDLTNELPVSDTAVEKYSVVKSRILISFIQTRSEASETKTCVSAFVDGFL